MKTVLLVLALFVAAAAASVVVTDDLVNTINQDKTSTWTAGHNQFSRMTRNQAGRMLGLKPRRSGVVRPTIRYEKTAKNSLPTAFDWRTKMPACVGHVLDQAQCGSCWAFGATEALSDRFCVASGGKTKVVLSPQDLVSCDSSDMGCNGGYLDNAWDYMKETGVVTLDCMPYTAGGGVVDDCPSSKKCTGSGTWKKYKAKTTYDVSSNVDDIMKEIYTNGPVEAGFEVYQDFFAYKSGVYQHKTGQLDGGHAIEIVGWGHDQDSGLDYWIVKNSWGATWGQSGYFWIKKGSDECNIESGVVAGEPALESSNPLDKLVISEDIIKKVNRENGGWTAGINKKFVGMTIRDAQKLLGARPRPRQYPVSFARPKTALPDEFDWRKQTPKCVHEILDQAQCGSCWAFGATESLSDRFCVASNGKIDIELAAQDLVSCDKTDNGCNGGNLQNAWAYMADKGVVTLDCMPYKSGTGSVPACPDDKCTGSGEWKKYYANETTIQTYTDAESDMTILHESGPVEASFAVYQDFMSYKSGVYEHKTGPLMGYHAVKAVGWGEDAGVKYWIVANSWGKGWGQDGYFWIKRGSNECMFEENMVAGLPILK